MLQQYTDGPHNISQTGFGLQDSGEPSVVGNFNEGSLLKLHYCSRSSHLYLRNCFLFFLLHYVFYGRRYRRDHFLLLLLLFYRKSNYHRNEWDPPVFLSRDFHDMKPGGTFRREILKMGLVTKDRWKVSYIERSNSVTSDMMVIGYRCIQKVLLYDSKYFDTLEKENRYFLYYFRS